MHQSSDEEIQGGERGSASWRDFPFRLGYLSPHLSLCLRKQSPEPSQGEHEDSNPQSREEEAATSILHRAKPFRQCLSVLRRWSSAQDLQLISATRMEPRPSAYEPAAQNICATWPQGWTQGTRASASCTAEPISSVLASCSACS